MFADPPFPFSGERTPRNTGLQMKTRLRIVFGRFIIVCFGVDFCTGVANTMN